MFIHVDEADPPSDGIVDPAETICIEASGRVPDIAGLQRFLSQSSVSMVVISGQMTDTSCLAGLSARVISIRTKSIRSLDGIEHVKGLSKLILAPGKAGRDITALARVSTLERLEIAATQRDLTTIAQCRLTFLELQGVRWSPLGLPVHVRELMISHTRRLDCLDISDIRAEILDLHSSSIRTLAGENRDVKVLSVLACPNIDLASIRRFGEVRMMTIGSNRELAVPELASNRLEVLVTRAPALSLPVNLTEVFPNLRLLHVGARRIKVGGNDLDLNCASESLARVTFTDGIVAYRGGERVQAPTAPYWKCE